jgi:hypothetical protein
MKTNILHPRKPTIYDLGLRVIFTGFCKDCYPLSLKQHFPLTRYAKDLALLQQNA